MHEKRKQAALSLSVFTRKSGHKSSRQPGTLTTLTAGSASQGCAHSRRVHPDMLDMQDASPVKRNPVKPKTAWEPPACLGGGQSGPWESWRSDVASVTGPVCPQEAPPVLEVAPPLGV